MADSTSITNIEAAASSTLVSDFNKQISSVETQALSSASKFTSIQNQIASISPVDFTPPAILDTTTSAALNKSMQSSAWLTSKDAGKQIQDIQNRCTVLQEIGATQMIEKMRGGVMDKALKDAGDAISDAIGGSGLSMPEFGIGEALSNIVNKGRAAYEAVEDEFSGIVSDVLETGKAAAAKAQAVVDQIGGAVSEGKKMVEKGLATMSGPLKKLDEIINCMDAVGGGAVVGETDQMIDALNNVYDKAGVKSDPNQPDFGEFDDTKFFNNIPGITPTQQSNLLKTTNMYDKAKNNASKAVDKAKELAEPDTQERSASSLGSAAPPSLPEKKEEIKKTSEVKFETPPTPEIPAAPGRPAQPAQPAVSTPAPEPSTPSTPEPDQEDPTPARVITMYKKTITLVDVWDEAGMTDYLAWDPNRTGYPLTKSNMMYNLIPFGGGTEKTSYVPLKLLFHVPGIWWSVEEGEDYSDGTPTSFTRISCNIQTWLVPAALDPSWGIERHAGGKFKWRAVPSADWKEPTSVQLERTAGVTVRRLLDWIAANDPYTYEDYEALL